MKECVNVVYYIWPLTIQQERKDDGQRDPLNTRAVEKKPVNKGVERRQNGMKKMRKKKNWKMPSTCSKKQKRS